MTDNARENGDKDAIVDNQDADAEAIWRELDGLTAKSEPAEVRTDGDNNPDDDDNTQNVDDSNDQGDDQSSTADDKDGPVVDEWEGIPEPIKARFEALQKENTKLEERVRTEVGRVAKTQRRIAELNKIIQSDGKSQDGTPDRKKLEELKQDYPEMYEAVAPIDQALQKMSEKERARVDDAKRELYELYEANSRQVNEYHPDRVELLEKHGDLFQYWAMHPQQSYAIREAALANAQHITDPQKAVDLLTEFKNWMGQTQNAPSQTPSAQPQTQPNDRRERQRQAAAAPRSGSRTPTVSGIPESGDPQQMWDAFEEMDRRRNR